MRTLSSGVVLFEHEDWRPIKSVMGYAMRLPVSEVIVHHSYIPSILCGDTVAREIESMRGMDRYATNDQSWGGFSYSYAIYQSGHCYVGRSHLRTGAHTAGKNSSTLGIVFVTDGSVHTLTHAARAAFQSLIAEMIRVKALSARYTLNPHDKYKNKVCPGAKIKVQLPLLLQGVTASWPTLRLGSRGPAVEHLQKHLISKGFMASGYPFGYFGTITQDGVILMQQEAGLLADGIVGEDTWELVP